MCKSKGKGRIPMSNDDGEQMLDGGASDASHALKPAMFSNGHVGGQSSPDTMPDEPILFPQKPTADDSSPPQGEAPIGNSNLSSLSAWNYRFRGGLRKMARRTPTSDQTTPKRALKRRVVIPTRFSRQRTDVPSEFSLRMASLRQQQFYRDSRADFSQSDKSVHSTHAYFPPSLVAIAADSPAGPVGSDSIGNSPPFSCANVEIFGNPSPGHWSHDSDQGESSYLARRELSPRPSFGLRSEFSRESLLVPPLRPPGESAEARLALSTSRSQDSFRAASLSSSVSAIIEEATCSVLFGATAVRVPIRSPGQSTARRLFLSHGSGRSRPSSSRQPQCSAASAIGGRDEDISSNSRWQSHAVCSRSTSAIGRRRSQSGRGAGVYSGSTELGDECNRLANTSGEYLVEPMPVYRKASSREPNNSTVRLIWNQDEHGDGLADLEKLHHHHPSRSIMYSLFTNCSSDRNLQSSSSSRSNSISHSSIPAWAKLYYGSGERRFLASALSSDSLLSDLNGRSRASSFLSMSPSADRFPAVIQSPRRRPFQANSQQRHDDMATRELEYLVSPFTPGQARIRLQDPTLFAVGFIFPLAWVIAAFLPLPPMPKPKMMQEHLSTSQIEAQLEADLTLGMSDIRFYSHARWWRTLNRAMSVVGIFVIGAIIALIVTGVRQRWRS
ncbi:hypothetical protein XA68_16757 [Ophiocordyceps unilateralis]|uniref:Serine-rich protein n=1 Tax=Ophiocordyceps unilateralis TaxID=268505 RepID=A0A2A9P614_OPHUN|nr:hypothetical protein XA68_16757 [Ophiocordyceps unilateralis]